MPFNRDPLGCHKEFLRTYSDYPLFSGEPVQKQ